MIDACIELHTGKEVPYMGDAIPRVGDHISLDGQHYEVVQVQWHCRKLTMPRARLQQVRILVREMSLSELIQALEIFNR